MHRVLFHDDEGRETRLASPEPLSKTVTEFDHVVIPTLESLALIGFLVSILDVLSCCSNRSTNQPFRNGLTARDL
jgi:hypothetical protein